jgi:ATP-dependent Clp protease ATP-binding subunit ClpA
MTGLKNHLATLIQKGVKPIFRDLPAGDGARELLDAEFRARNALAGNEGAIDAVFSLIARQASQGRSIFGPFLFVGTSGKGALARALATPGEGKMLIESDLGTCTASHTVSSFLGAPAGYRGCDQPAAFAARISALNAAVSSLEGDLPLPVVLFSNADRAHPDVLAALCKFFLTGNIQPYNSPAVSLTRGVIILAAAGLGPAIEALRFRAADDIQPDLRGLVERCQSGGEAVFPRSLVDAAAIVPLFEPTPNEILAHLSTRCGRDVALDCGVEPTRTGRLRLGPTAIADVWRKAAISPTDGAGHIIAALQERWAVCREYCSKDAAVQKRIAQRPAEGCYYRLDVGRGRKGMVLEELPFPGEPTRTSGIVLPLSYLERTLGPDAVTRSDYWDLPESFEKDLAAAIIGQDKTLAEIALRMRGRLAEKKGGLPVISFIVIGPTGTGKSELGRAIARITGHREIFCPCNEWQTAEAVKAGIFGTDKTSVASQLAENPAGVVIFDEVDKAHPKFWEFYMGVGDTGQIVDRRTGASVSLRHAVVEMTSNYLSDQLGTMASQAAEKSVVEMDPIVRKVLAQCAGINAACIERLDLAAIMMPVEGPDAYPIWLKFVRQKLSALGMEGVPIAPEVPAFMECLHLDIGGSSGARARRRTCDDLINRWHAGIEKSFVLDDGEFCLAAALRNSPILIPRSERQRLWGVTPKKAAAFKDIYTGNDEISDFVLNLLRVEGSKAKPRSPMGVILLVGPTGCGKTYLGISIAKAFNKGDPIRVDCSQCSSEEAVTAVLFGGVVGYRNCDCGGLLTRPVLSRRDQVVILDEIDRADPSIFDATLGAFDEGVALDRGSNLSVDLKQCLFILTSNLAADALSERIGQMNGATLPEKQAAAREIIAATGVLAPEKLARIQFVLPLIRRPGANIGRDEVRRAVRAVLDEFGCTLTVSPEVEVALAAACQASPYRDIRSITRTVQSMLEDALLGGDSRDFEAGNGVLRMRRH